MAKPNPPSFETYRPSEERAAVSSHAGADLLWTAGEDESRDDGAARPKRKRTVWRWLGTGALIVLALVAAVAAFFFAAPPMAMFEREAIAAVKAGTGREFTTSRPASLTLLPFGVAMHGVTLAGRAPSDEPLMTADAVEAHIEPWALLRGRVEVRQVVVKKPFVNLSVAKDGARSWEFAGQPSKSVRLAQAADPSVANDAGGPAAAPRPPARRGETAIRVRDFRIEDGVIRYADERRGLAREASGVTAEAVLDETGDALSANGFAALDDETATFEAKVGSVEAAVSRKPFNLSFAATGEASEITFDGEAVADDGLRLKGKASSTGASLASLVDFAGGKLPFLRGAGAFKASGDIETGDRSFTLTGATFDLGGVASGTGDVTLDASRDRPLWKGKIALAELNLDRPVADEEPAPGGAEPAPEQDGPQPADGPAVKGYAERRGWSEEPIDWSALGDADADLEITAEKVRRADVEAGPARLRILNENGVLEAAFQDVKLYGGAASGVLKIDSTAKPAAATLEASGENVDMGRLLKDSGRLEWLSGTGKFSAKLKGAGDSERAIVEALAGSAILDIGDGALAGWNLDKIARRVSEGKKPKLERSSSEKTAFKAMTASFDVKNGVAENKDLAITSALVEVRGAGKANLARREIDYVLRPKLVGAEPGALDIPVKLNGSWEKPRVAADFSAMVKDPDKALSAIKEIGKKLKGKKVGEIVRGLLGDGDERQDREGWQPDPPQ